MIEPTDEMRRAFLAEHDDACDQKGCGRPECLDVRLAAVLAIVERDYDVEAKTAPVEHRSQGEAWWNHYAEQWEVECICGESFADGYRDRAKDRLLDHMESSS